MKIDLRTKAGRALKKKARRQEINSLAGKVTLALLASLILTATLSGWVKPGLLSPIQENSTEKRLREEIKELKVKCQQPLNPSPTLAVVTPNLKNTTKPTSKTSDKKTSEIEALVKSTFHEEPEVMLAVLKHESGLKPNAQGWNCLYEVNGKKVSKACKVEDRANAWSTDCGVAQNNFPGTVCPSYAFNVEWSLKEGRRKYDINEKAKKGTGKYRWTSYKSGAYKRHLATN